jgi:CheY-like chemotaxis protein
MITPTAESSFRASPFSARPRPRISWTPSPSEFQGKSAEKTFKRKGRIKRILVIDDETSVADSLAEILTNVGYDAVACYSGAAAIECARQECADAVISDVVMPKMNGIDAVLAIRGICPQVRILLFSGQAGTSDLLEKARADGHRFELLPKPIHPDQLLKRLSTLWN